MLVPHSYVVLSELRNVDARRNGLEEWMKLEGWTGAPPVRRMTERTVTTAAPLWKVKQLGRSLLALSARVWQRRAERVAGCEQC
jgi:hypothetical protein